MLHPFKVRNVKSGPEIPNPDLVLGWDIYNI
jgi:hypothetical protein